MSRIAPIIASIAAAVCMVALFVPWWNAEVDGTFPIDGEDFTFSGSGAVAPLANGDGMVSTAEAVTVAVPAIIGLLLVAFAASVMLGFAPQLYRWAAFVALGGSLLVAVALLLSVSLWPEDGSFWDSRDAGGVSVVHAAGIGWYLALAAAAGAASAGIIHLRQQSTSPSEEPLAQ